MTAEKGIMLSLRLNDQEIECIRNIVRRHFGDTAMVYLFGSRADVKQSGGDIDLYVQADVAKNQRQAARLGMITDLQLALGDQKIDVIVGEITSSPKSFIEREALRTGVRL